MHDEQHKQLIDETFEKIQKLIHDKDLVALSAELSHHHTATIVEVMNELEPREQVVLFRLLKKERASRVFSRLDSHAEEQLLGHLKHSETISLIRSLKPDDRVGMLEELPAGVTRRLLDALEPEDRAEAVTLLGYPEDSVGRLMTPDFVAVKADWKVERAMAHIRARANESETVNSVYVVDDAWTLLGYVSLSRLVLAKPDQTIKDFMQTRVRSITATEDRENTVNVMNDYRLSVIPVVDTNDSLIGIVTFDDITRVAEEEVTEDFHKSSAISPLEHDYSHASILSLFRSRIGWLGILLVVNLASASVIGAYEDTLAAAITLVFFMPLLIAAGGNTGVQSATLMIRGLSTGDIRMRNWLRTFGKEMFVGLILAVVLGVAASGLGLFRGGSEIGLIVGLSMISIVFLANVIGSLLPFILMKLKQDPAVASGPLVTSVADVMGLIIYFGIATAVLGQVA